MSTSITGVQPCWHVDSCRQWCLSMAMHPSNYSRPMSRRIHTIWQFVRKHGGGQHKLFMPCRLHAEWFDLLELGACQHKLFMPCKLHAEWFDLQHDRYYEHHVNL
ncbi:MAG: hypothetical protein Q8O64_20750 [Sideroxyarcus sp.]|nr:hypothetical protein [Sideroxyarcus sp.]